MLYKKILILFILGFYFNSSFCMELNKNVCEKHVENSITRGEKVFSSIVECFENKKSLIDKSKILQFAANNIIEFGMHKVINSRNDLLFELKRVPFLGRFMWLIESIFFRSFDNYIKNLKKEKNNIKIEFNKIFIKEISDKFVELSKKEVDLEIQKKEEVNKVDYKYWFDSEIKDFDSIDKNEPENALDLLCIANNFAVNHKEFVRFFLEKADVISLLGSHDLLYKTLSAKGAPQYIEEKLERAYFPEKFSKKIELV